MKIPLIVFIILSGLSGAPAQTGLLGNGEINQRASSMVEAAKAYIRQKSSTLPNDMSLRVARRLYQCFAISGLLANKPKSPEAEVNHFRNAMAVYFLAAKSLYPGGDSILKRDVPGIINQLEAIQKRQKALFYLTRSCRDFLEAKSTEDAVLELAFD